ncbi:MAG: hypothetical protein JNK82_44895 [Myxococcaceae bacterium]|nr:hypothetical protein [Myxococcaceae bacterium]
MSISARYRIGLLFKSLLLLALAVLFTALFAAGTLGANRQLLTRVVSLVVFGVCTAFLYWTAALALFDAVLGRAVRVTNAVALPPRRLSGVSFRVAGGRPAEFLLYNPWAPLETGAPYSLVVGRWSRVLVEPPVREAAQGQPASAATTTA